jgi:hypothetical protein
VIALLLAAALGQAAAAIPAPSQLHAVSATKDEIKLAWQPSASATGYVVESLEANKQWKAIGPAKPAAAATIPAAQFATYTFRVKATGAGDALSAPSNEITVGPPPTGYHGVIPIPKTLKNPTQFAPKVSMALDDNGDPAFAYTVIDPNNDQALEDSRIEFVSWNRAAYTWTAPVAVDQTGDISSAGATEPLSLAVDATTHRFGIAYLVAPKAVKIAMSADRGVTWTPASVVNDSDISDSPSLALAGGRVYLAYYHGEDGIRYHSGAQADAPSKWTSAQAPKLPGTKRPRRIVSVAVDSANQPALAYLLEPEEDLNQTIAFWRPGSSPIKAGDSNGQPTDEPFVQLSFAGKQPSLILFLKRDDKFFDNGDQIWVVRSTGEGTVWSEPVPLPNDGGNSMGSPASLAVSSSGRLTANALVDGGNQIKTRCGQPKLIQSTDGVKWTICSPGSPTGTPTSDLTQPHLLLAGNDKLYIGFVAAKSGGGIPAGIVLWREP